LVANQNSNDIVIFKINKKTGLLSDTGKKIRVPKPVCLQWIN
jgi:6-phosphogluconolactonase